jgi:hypothetical protein
MANFDWALLSLNIAGFIEGAETHTQGPNAPPPARGGAGFA